jgi:hypothetical protein
MYVNPAAAPPGVADAEGCAAALDVAAEAPVPLGAAELAPLAPVELPELHAARPPPATAASTAPTSTLHLRRITPLPDLESQRC